MKKSSSRSRPPKVSVIVVTRNRKKEVLDCLNSLYASTHKNLQVILVDNNSQDETVKIVKKSYPRAEVIALPENTGPWQGKNIGEKAARGKYIFFLDSDTVVDNRCLSEMVALAESDQSVDFICPKIYYFDKRQTIWCAGAAINLLTSQAKNRGTNEEDRGQFDQVVKTGYSPTAYLVTAKLAKKLNGHRQDLFMSFGESDYGYRAQKEGAKVVFCPKAKLWHRINQAENIHSIRALGFNLPLRAYYFARNRMVFMKAHASRFNFFVFLVIFFPALTLYITGKIIAFRGWQFLVPHFEGTIDGIKYLFTGRLDNSRWT
jgi:GT2 family glycosyltransferase